jgi:hypothetical protein
MNMRLFTRRDKQNNYNPVNDFPGPRSCMRIVEIVIVTAVVGRGFFI